MRRFLIAGNWKMNKGPSEAESLLVKLKEEIPEIPESVDVLVCPPYTSITAANNSLQGYDAQIGAQNMHFENNGAFTGEISPGMLQEVGCTYVILGHSERRQYFAETDELVNKKATKALAEDLTPVICVGESLDQRKAGNHVDIVRAQVEKALNGINEQDVTDVVIAYEPIWAIGTGETASPEQAQEMHADIRSVLSDLYSDEAADQIQILYGGSMKPHNADELLNQPDVDGGLIGGASLKGDSFAAIIRIAESLS